MSEIRKKYLFNVSGVATASVRRANEVMINQQNLGPLTAAKNTCSVTSLPADLSNHVRPNASHSSLWSYYLKI